MGRTLGTRAHPGLGGEISQRGRCWSHPLAGPVRFCGVAAGKRAVSARLPLR